MQWLRNLFRGKQPKRELPLIHVHTFKTGERLYTYKASDWGKISSRYYRAIQELLKAIQSFGMLPYQWKSAIGMVKENNMKALKGQFDPVEAATDTIQTMDYFLAKFNSTGSLDEEYYLALFNMFYILEEEKETGYSELYNDKKRQLLNDEPDARDFFLTRLKKDTQNLMDGSLTTIKRHSSKIQAEVKQVEKQWNPANTTSNTLFQKKS